LVLRDVTKHHTAHRAASRRAWRVTGRFAPSSVLPFTYSTFPAYFPAYSVKAKHHRLDVLTIFQRGARGAVFRDFTLGKKLTITDLL